MAFSMGSFGNMRQKSIFIIFLGLWDRIQFLSSFLHLVQQWPDYWTTLYCSCSTLELCDTL